MMWSLNSRAHTALSGDLLTLYAAEDSNSRFLLEDTVSEAADVVAVYNQSHMCEVYDLLTWHKQTNVTHFCQ
jgi:hypothetical protein